MFKYDRNGVRCPMNCNQLATPFQIFDQNFALGLHDEDIPYPFHWSNGHRPQRLHSGLESGRSQVECTKDMFQVKLDVQHFAPEEVDVKVVEDFVVIKGKHEERLDDHGYVSREFTRKYHLPPGVKAENVTCSRSSDGVLVISAKRLALPAPDDKETPIAIMHTGKPAVADRRASFCSMNQEDQKNGDDHKK